MGCLFLASNSHTATKATGEGVLPPPKPGWGVAGWRCALRLKPKSAGCKLWNPWLHPPHLASPRWCQGKSFTHLGRWFTSSPLRAGIRTDSGPAKTPNSCSAPRRSVGRNHSGCRVQGR